MRKSQPVTRKIRALQPNIRDTDCSAGMPRLSYKKTSRANLSTRAARSHYYFVIEPTTPAPTVRPPSRMAKRKPMSIAIGAMSLTPSVTLSPGSNR